MWIVLSEMKTTYSCVKRRVDFFRLIKKSGLFLRDQEEWTIFMIKKSWLFLRDWEEWKSVLVELFAVYRYLPYLILLFNVTNLV